MTIRRTRIGELKYSFDENTRTHNLTSNYVPYSKYGIMSFFCPTESYKEGDAIKINGTSYVPYTNDGNQLGDNYFVGEGTPFPLEENDKCIIEIITEPDSGSVFLNKLIVDKLNVIEYDSIDSDTIHITTEYAKIHELEFVSAPSFNAAQCVAKAEITVKNTEGKETFMTFKFIYDDVDLTMYPQGSFRKSDESHTFEFFIPLDIESSGLHKLEIYTKVNDSEVEFDLLKNNVKAILRGINIYVKEEGYDATP